MTTSAPRGGPLALRHGTASHPDRPAARPRPPGTSDATIAALGKLSEALEAVEQARGLLYGFHRLCGTADLTLQEAVGLLREAGHAALADDIEQTLVGRDIVPGKWSFQLVEDYDAGYWGVFRDVEDHARAELGVPARHVFEAEMKEREQRDPADNSPGADERLGRRLDHGGWACRRRAGYG
jgi:hypothetical protein